MLAKAKTILDAIRSGVRDIHVINAKKRHVLIEELFTSQGVGTRCRAQARD
jgi:acetylglutamate kinase